MLSEKYESVVNALVLKVKEGGNEGVNAKRALEKLCKKYNLDIEEILNDSEKSEDRYYKITPKTEVIVAQVIRRYGESQEIYNTRSRKFLVVELTTAKHLEVTNALDVLLPLYKKEVKKMQQIVIEAFVNKHDLFWKGPRPELIGKEKEKTIDERVEEMKRGAIIVSVANSMEDAAIHKRIS